MGKTGIVLNDADTVASDHLGDRLRGRAAFAVELSDG
jgi:hypothetical protein